MKTYTNEFENLKEALVYIEKEYGKDQALRVEKMLNTGEYPHPWGGFFQNFELHMQTLTGEVKLIEPTKQNLIKEFADQVKDHIITQVKTALNDTNLHVCPNHPDTNIIGGSFDRLSETREFSCKCVWETTDFQTWTLKDLPDLDPT